MLLFLHSQRLSMLSSRMVGADGFTLSRIELLVCLSDSLLGDGGVTVVLDQLLLLSKDLLIVLVALQIIIPLLLNPVVLNLLCSLHTALVRNSISTGVDTLEKGVISAWLP